MGKLMKTERVLEGNICNLFAILMSVCDSDTRNQVKASIEFATRDMSLDSIGMLSFTKKILYTGGTNSQNVKHKKAKVQMSLMILYQEGF